MNSVLINEIGLGQGVRILLKSHSNNRSIRVAREQGASRAYLHGFQVLDIFPFRMQQLLGNVGSGMRLCTANCRGELGWKRVAGVFHGEFGGR